MKPTLLRIAHRGGGSLAPENSLAGIERSLELGLEMIEIDLRRTRDGAIVLSHPDSLPGAPAPIADLTLAELRQSPANDIATLDEALDIVKGRAMLNLDVKAGGLADRLVATVRDQRAVDACVVTCLNRAWLAEISSLEPRLSTLFSYPPDYGGASERGWLTPVVDSAAFLMRVTLPYRLRAMLQTLPNTGACIWYRLVTGRLVALVHELDAPLYVWTVDDLAEMKRFAALGVDGITSNRPDLLAELGDRRKRE